MKFKLHHNNINVSNLDTSLKFYKEMLGLLEHSRIEREAFTIVYLKNDQAEHFLELTFLKDHPHKYDLGENEIHIAFTVDDYDGAYRLHKNMGVICYENPSMGIYFIEDPDGYWLEVMPGK